MQLLVRSFLAVGLIGSGSMMSSTSWAQEEAKPITAVQAEADKSVEATVVEDSPAKLTAEDYMKKAAELLAQKLPEGLSNEERSAFIKNTIESAMAFNDEAVNLKPEGTLRIRVLSQRYTLMRIGTINNLDGYQEKSEKFLNEVSTDPDEKVAAMGKSWMNAFKLSTLGRLPEAERLALITEMKSEILAGELTPQKASEAANFARTIERFVTAEQSVAVYKEFSERLSQSENEALRKMAEGMLASARRVDLPGHPMELIGKKLDGSDFVISDLKGKVVLVDFWATWCGPCIAEFPNMKEMYGKYHSHGFEIVGISLDKKAEVVKEFVASKEIPWMILHYPENQTGWDHPAAVYYGINAIPAMVLIGADGNVISTHARGEALKELLEKSFPDVKENAPAPAETTASE